MSPAAVDHGLRVAIVALCLVNLVWTIPGAWQAIRGNLAAQHGFRLSHTAVLLGLLGWQESVLSGRTELEPTWRNVGNLALIAIGFALLLAAWWIRARELEDRYGEVTPLIRAWRRWRGRGE